VSVFAENPIQKYIQTPRDWRRSSKQGKFGCEPIKAVFGFYLLFTVIFWSLNFDDFKICFFLDLVKSNIKSNQKFLKMISNQFKSLKIDVDHDFKIIKSNQPIGYSAEIIPEQGGQLRTTIRICNNIKHAWRHALCCNNCKKMHSLSTLMQNTTENGGPENEGKR